MAECYMIIQYNDTVSILIKKAIMHLRVRVSCMNQLSDYIFEWVSELVSEWVSEFEQYSSNITAYQLNVVGKPDVIMMQGPDVYQFRET